MLASSGFFMRYLQWWNTYPDVAGLAEIPYEPGYFSQNVDGMPSVDNDSIVSGPSSYEWPECGTPALTLSPLSQSTPTVTCKDHAAIECREQPPVDQEISFNSDTSKWNSNTDTTTIRWRMAATRHDDERSRQTSPPPPPPTQFAPMASRPTPRPRNLAVMVISCSEPPLLLPPPPPLPSPPTPPPETAQTPIAPSPPLPSPPSPSQLAFKHMESPSASLTHPFTELPRSPSESQTPLLLLPSKQPVPTPSPPPPPPQSPPPPLYASDFLFVEDTGDPKRIAAVVATGVEVEEAMVLAPVAWTVTAVEVFAFQMEIAKSLWMGESVRPMVTPCV
ncbi:unnamed protein product [Schistocephalus solidus]|uniref:Extensin-like n=1 Tax=Schistocephalus solidus TaxID=70667 RepID=A0A183SAM6_SCHSO|nr:unnamed protein product [Schistocephalus solidus]